MLIFRVPRHRVCDGRGVNRTSDHRNHERIRSNGGQGRGISGRGGGSGDAAYISDGPSFIGSRITINDRHAVSRRVPRDSWVCIGTIGGFPVDSRSPSGSGVGLSVNQGPCGGSREDVIGPSPNGKQKGIASHYRGWKGSGYGIGGGSAESAVADPNYRQFLFPYKGKFVSLLFTFIKDLLEKD